MSISSVVTLTNLTAEKLTMRKETFGKAFKAFHEDLPKAAKALQEEFRKILGVEDIASSR